MSQVPGLLPGATLADFLLRSEQAILEAALNHSRGDAQSRAAAMRMEAEVRSANLSRPAWMLDEC